MHLSNYFKNFFFLSTIFGSDQDFSFSHAALLQCCCSFSNAASCKYRHATLCGDVHYKFPSWFLALLSCSLIYINFHISVEIWSPSCFAAPPSGVAAEPNLRLVTTSCSNSAKSLKFSIVNLPAKQNQSVLGSNVAKTESRARPALFLSTSCCFTW